MINVLKYIWNTNSGFDKLRFLLSGVCFQIHKRMKGTNQTKTLFNNKKIILFPSCTISSTFAYTSIPDKEEIILLRSLCDDKTVFLDIGANIGSYSVCLSDIAKEVIAFEPHPFTASRCLENFRLNSIPEKSLQQVALSDTSGKAYFSDHGHSSTVNQLIQTNDGIEVEVTTLDEFARKNLSKEKDYLLKVDVEGFEMNLFKGSLSFFNEWSIKGLLFETFQKDVVFPYLKACGFKDIKQLSENNYFATKY